MIREVVAAGIAFWAALYVPSSALRAETANPSAHTWTKEFAGQALDLTGYDLSFSDEFNADTITGNSGSGPWFAPGRASYGLATFDSPNGSTYTIDDGVMKIRATRAADGKWHAGSAQTVDPSGKGFAQRYGYFEARMKVPAMPGAWCAFWLKSQAEHWDRSIVRTEIDVVEWYGGDPTGHHRAVHLWPPSKEFRTADRLSEHWYLGNFSRHKELAGNWHTYGALITPDMGDNLLGPSRNWPLSDARRIQDAALSVSEPDSPQERGRLWRFLRLIWRLITCAFTRSRRARIPTSVSTD